MDTYSRNVATIGTAINGGLLLCGMFLFILGYRGESLYKHPSPAVATFSVFWFAFSPTLLFMGATVPWVCALCGSRAAAIAFTVIPAGLFVVISVYWAMLYDTRQQRYRFAEVPQASLRSHNTVNLDYLNTGAAVPFAYANSAGGVGGAIAAVEMPSLRSEGVERAVFPPRPTEAWHPHAAATAEFTDLHQLPYNRQTAWQGYPPSHPPSTVWPAPASPPQGLTWASGSGSVAVTDPRFFSNNRMGYGNGAVRWPGEAAAAVLYSPPPRGPPLMHAAFPPAAAAPRSVGARYVA